MIKVVRLNGAELYINPDLVMTLEASPDVLLTLTNGEKYVLKDNIDTVVQRFIAYKQTIQNPLNQ